MNSIVPPWVFLFGPTAVGKTQMLIDLVHQGYKIEVISADAFQIYRGFDIGTAKPHSDLLKIVPHHLIDICNPDEIYNVSSFLHDAKAAALDIHHRGAIPVVSGGTAFYYRHLLYGLPEAPAVDPLVRLQIEGDFIAHGLPALYKELTGLDPLRAEQVHPNDAYRIQRALEICRSTGRPQSSFATTGRDGLLQSHGNIIILGLQRDREVLRERIKMRIRAMFDQGLAEEFSQLVHSGLHKDSPAMRAIGYREFFESADLAVVEELINHHTSQYAKRQMTFFRSFETCVWFDAEDLAGIAQRLDQGVKA